MRTILTLAIVVLLGSAGPATAGVRVAWSPRTSGDLLSARVLTQDGPGRYQISQADGVVTMTASQDVGNNQREVFHPSGQTSMLDAQVCATWASGPDSAQQGVALRIVRTSTSTRALTVTKNVWAGAYWTLNAHAWDSSLPAPFVGLGSAQFFGLWDGDRPHPLPWRVCAKVVDSFLAVKIWRLVEPEPRWDDPAHAAVWTVPQEWVVPGKAGWYIGHLPAGTTATYADLGVWGYGS